ncbi:MAG: hypothetical protein Q9219_000757 [cf. Caloplaca sp. 3 TL-2023]
MRTGTLSTGPEKLYILVMGLTGAGKSTFIKDLTGNPNIPIGAASDLQRGKLKMGKIVKPSPSPTMTEEVQDYVLLYASQGTTYEVHLIDSPGFDDDVVGDVHVLQNIANYVNLTYKLKERLAGVLYLHDITKAKMGGVGKRNIRMLEQMIGLDKFKNCTIVTTKWGSTNQQDAEDRETSLRTDKNFFGSMLQTGQHAHDASLRRYSPKSKECALTIIRPYLRNKFTAEISKQMVASRGPKLPLGKTEAGKLVADNLEELAKYEEENEQLREAKFTLSKHFDENLFRDFRRSSRNLRHKIARQRSGRWIMRMGLVGGAIVATVLTLGPGASAFSLEPAIEIVFREQREDEKRAKAKLEEEFEEKSKGGSGRLSAYSPEWMWDSKVKNMEDLNSEGYSIISRISNDMAGVANRGENCSIISRISDDLLMVVKRGEVVGVAAEGGMAVGDIMLAAKEIAEDSTTEDSEWSDSSGWD